MSNTEINVNNTHGINSSNKTFSSVMSKGSDWTEPDEGLLPYFMPSYWHPLYNYDDAEILANMISYKKKFNPDNSDITDAHNVIGNLIERRESIAARSTLTWLVIVSVLILIFMIYTNNYNTLVSFIIGVVIIAASINYFYFAPRSGNFIRREKMSHIDTLLVGNNLQQAYNALLSARNTNTLANNSNRSLSTAPINVSLSSIGSLSNIFGKK